MHGCEGNTLHRPSGLPPLVTLATQVTVPAHKAGPTDAAALDVAALRHGTGGAAATGDTVLQLSVPPAVRLDQSQRREGVSRTERNNTLKVQGGKNSKEDSKNENTAVVWRKILIHQDHCIIVTKRDHKLTLEKKRKHLMTFDIRNLSV